MAKVSGDLASKIKGEISGLKSYAVRSLVTMAQSKGTFDLMQYDEFTTDLKKMLGEKFADAEKSIKKQIDKATKDGVDPKDLDPFLKEYQDVKKDYEDKIVTAGGIRELVGEFSKDQLVDRSIFLSVSDRNNSPRMMDSNEKKEVKNLIMPHINLPKALTDEMLASGKAFADQASKIMSDRIAKAFGTKVGDIYVLDKTKLTSKHAAAVGNEISTAISSASLLDNIIKEVEQKQKVKLTPEVAQKITDALVPTIAKLGSDYIKNNEKSLTNELVSSLRSGQSYTSWLTRSYDISAGELNRIASKIDKKHEPMSIGASSEIIADTMRKRSMTNTDITKRLEQIAEATGVSIDFGKPLGVKDIAEIRRSVSAKKFDEIFDAPTQNAQNQVRKRAATDRPNQVEHGAGLTAAPTKNRSSTDTTRTRSSSISAGQSEPVAGRSAGQLAAQRASQKLESTPAGSLSRPKSTNLSPAVAKESDAVVKELGAKLEVRRARASTDSAARPLPQPPKGISR